MGRKFYIHDSTRGYVGNCMIWWRRGHCGYTANVGAAHVFDESELPRYLEAEDLVAYPVEHVDAVKVSHVDMQEIDTRLAVYPDDVRRQEGTTDGE